MRRLLTDARSSIASRDLGLASEVPVHQTWFYRRTVTVKSRPGVLSAVWPTETMFNPSREFVVRTGRLRPSTEADIVAPTGIVSLQKSVELTVTSRTIGAIVGASVTVANMSRIRWSVST